MFRCPTDVVVTRRQRIRAGEAPEVARGGQVGTRFGSPEYVQIIEGKSQKIMSVIKISQKCVGELGPSVC